MPFLYRRSVPSPDSERLCLRSRWPDERPLQRLQSRLRTGQRTSRSLNKEKTSRLQQISSLSPSESQAVPSIITTLPPPSSPPNDPQEPKTYIWRSQAHKPMPRIPDSKINCYNDQRHFWSAMLYPGRLLPY